MYRSVSALGVVPLAHPVTGDPSTGTEIATVAAGAAVALAGIVLLVMGRQRGADSSARLARGGIPLVLFGVLVAAVGPSLFRSVAGGCGRPSTEARVEIAQPTEGQAVDGPTVPVRVTLRGGELAQRATTTNRPDEGHLHLSLDGKLVSMTGEREQEIQVPPGNHELSVEFVANDHAPFCTRVMDRVRFTVTGRV